MGWVLKCLNWGIWCLILFLLGIWVKISYLLGQKLLYFLFYPWNLMIFPNDILGDVVLKGKIIDLLFWCLNLGKTEYHGRLEPKFPWKWLKILEKKIVEILMMMNFRDGLRVLVMNQISWWIREALFILYKYIVDWANPGWSFGDASVVRYWSGSIAKIFSELLIPNFPFLNLVFLNVPMGDRQLTSLNPLAIQLSSLQCIPRKCSLCFC